MPEYLEATLGALSVGLALWNEVDLGTVTYEDEETANIYADVNTQLARRSGKLRQQHYTIRLRGASKDDLITQENALRTELRKEVNTLVVKPRNATNAVTFVVRRNPALAAPFDLRYEKANLAYCDVVLVCEPWGYGSSEALFTASAQTSPVLVSLGTLVGQDDPRLALTVTSAVHPAVAIASSTVAAATVVTTAAPHLLPIGTSTVTIAGSVGSTPTINGTHAATVLTATTFSVPVNCSAGATAGGTAVVAAAVGMAFALVALCTGGTNIEDYVFEAEGSGLDAPWYSYDGNPNCAGGLSARLDSADTTAWTALTAVVPAAGPSPGRYRVMVRARATDGDEGYLAKRKQYSTARDPSTTVTLNNVALTWNDLGEWVHYGSDPLRLYGKSVIGGLYVDRVVLVPVDFGLAWYRDPAEDTHLVRLGWLYDHKFTTTGAPTVELDATGRLQGHGIKAPLEDFGLLVFIEPAGSDPAPVITLDATYLPRWEMFR